MSALAQALGDRTGEELSRKGPKMTSTRNEFEKTGGFLAEHASSLNCLIFGTPAKYAQYLGAAVWQPSLFSTLLVNTAR